MVIQGWRVNRKHLSKLNHPHVITDDMWKHMNVFAKKHIICILTTLFNLCSKASMSAIYPRQSFHYVSFFLASLQYSNSLVIPQFSKFSWSVAYVILTSPWSFLFRSHNSILSSIFSFLYSHCGFKALTLIQISKLFP